MTLPPFLSKDKADLILANEVYAIVGAAIEVHKELGPGFLETVYQEANQNRVQKAKQPFHMNDV